MTNEDNRRITLSEMIDDCLKEKLDDTDGIEIIHTRNCEYHENNDDYDCNCKPEYNHIERPNLRQKAFKEFLAEYRKKGIELENLYTETMTNAPFDYQWQRDIFPRKRYADERHPFFRVAKFLWRKTSKTSTENLSKHLDEKDRNITIRKKEYKKALMTIDYELMEKKTKLSKSQIRRYLREFIKVGVLTTEGKAGENGKAIYSIAYYTGKGIHETKKPYVTKTDEWINKLKSMRFR